MRSVARLRIHPIKGARGLDVKGLDFDQLGPRFDRRWMVVGPDGTFVSQRVAPRLATVRPSIDGDALRFGDLSRYDVIVTGVRAYERNQVLRANNDRLLEYVEAGGTLVVQYNKFEFNQAQYGPYPAAVSRNRVTDEAAPVRILANDHPVFAWPNPIGAATWERWVQERGLYFLGARDDRYTDLVELEDTFEYNPGPKRGRSSRRSRAAGAGSMSASGSGVSFPPARPARTRCSPTCSVWAPATAGSGRRDSCATLLRRRTTPSTAGRAQFRSPP